MPGLVEIFFEGLCNLLQPSPSLGVDRSDMPSEQCPTLGSSTPSRGCFAVRFESSSTAFLKLVPRRLSSGAAILAPAWDTATARDSALLNAHGWIEISVTGARIQTQKGTTQLPSPSPPGASGSAILPASIGRSPTSATPLLLNCARARIRIVDESPHFWRTMSLGTGITAHTQ